MPSDPHREELFRAVIGFQQAALKAVYFLNGGAVVGVLAFVGSCPEAAQYIYHAMALWIGGLVLAAVATFFLSRAQFCFYSEYNQKQKGDEQEAKNWYGRGNSARYRGWASAMISLGAFCAASFVALSSLEHFAHSCG